MSDNPILLDLPARLIGDRVVVRPWQAGDGQALFEAVDESREHILPYLPWGPSHESPEATEAMVRRWHANWLTREDMVLAILNHDESHVLGGTGIHRIDWNVSSFEIGYWIRESEHQKGYVTEAVRLVIKMICDYMQPSRIHIRCATSNSRSIAIPQRLGFTHEGTLRNTIRDTQGNLHDIETFSLIPGEFDRPFTR